jgi:endonuclease/exonuclease/phosphatase (EEP) superfamily protein YafD
LTDDHDNRLRDHAAPVTVDESQTKPLSDDPSGATPATADGNARRHRVLVVVALALAWSYVALLAVIAISIWGGMTRFGGIITLLQGLVPIVFVPIWVLAVIALLTKRRILAAVCAVLALTHLVLVLPALGTNRVPAWAATAPRIKVFSANLFDRNTKPDQAAARVMKSDADVLALVEVSVAVHDALVRDGINRLFPYQVRDRASPSGDTDGIYSRIPFTDGQSLPLLENNAPTVTVWVDGRPIQIVAVHIDGAQHQMWKFTGELAALQPIARSAFRPLVITGDFNATRWNPPFADLLHIGLTDAHEDRGKGLSRSWPLTGTKLAHFGPLLRLDHALVNRTAAVMSVKDIRVPGSDHLAFEVQLAIGTGI